MQKLTEYLVGLKRKEPVSPTNLWRALDRDRLSPEKKLVHRAYMVSTRANV